MLDASGSESVGDGQEIDGSGERDIESVKARVRECILAVWCLFDDLTQVKRFVTLE